MKIYIAAPYPERKGAIALMNHLELNGHEVTSRWLREHDALDDPSAQKDLDDVAAADVLLAMGGEEWANAGTGGRHVEFGYALALGKVIVLLGARTNIFHHLKAVRVVRHVADLEGMLS